MIVLACIESVWLCAGEVCRSSGDRGGFRWNSRRSSGRAWILLVGENVQVGEVEEREEQGQSGLQVAVQCNAGDSIIFRFVLKYIHIYTYLCFRDQNLSIIGLDFVEVLDLIVVDM